MAIGQSRDLILAAEVFWIHCNRATWSVCKELANLVERLDKASTAYGMEISAEKTKLMTNYTSGQNTALSCTTTRPMEIHQY